MALVYCADIGSSSLKAALIDTAGFLHAVVRIPYGAAQDPAGRWLAAFFAAAEQLAAAVSRSGVSIPAAGAVVISGNGPTLVPVVETNGALESLVPVYWYEAPLRIEYPGGNSPGGKFSGGYLPSFFLAKAEAFRKANPGSFAKLRYFFSPQEWLSWRLGARPVTVLPHPAYENYYWDKTQCAALGIERELFPSFVTMGTVIGSLDPAACAAGQSSSSAVRGLLPPGIPIVAGASDFIMALVGTGTLKDGAVCDRTGSSEGINLCITGSAKEVPGLRFLPGAAEGLWNLGAVITQSGKLFDDYRVSSGQTEKPHAALLREILASPNHPGRPVLETMGRAFLNGLDNLEQSGRKIKELTLSGGQASDTRWNQYKADISGRVLHLPEITDAELAGNAILGAMALEGGNLQEKAAAMIRIKTTFYPGDIITL
ncbi:sugar kinase [Spirochaetia bacterium]|nr:sugar kinase [Spirochaetia bacterium]